MKMGFFLLLFVVRSVAFADSCYMASNPNHAFIQSLDEDSAYKAVEIATNVTLKFTDEKKDGEELRPATAEINATSASLRFRTVAIRTSPEDSKDQNSYQYGVECDGGTVYFFNDGDRVEAFTHHLDGSVTSDDGGCEGLGAISLSNISFAPVRCE